MPPLRGCNDPRPCDRPMRPMRPTGRCHHQSSITCLPALRENLDPPAPGGFFVSESAKGRAPSLCSLCSLRIDGGGSPPQPGAPEVEQRGQRGTGESRARASEAREFLSRRRRILKNRDTRDSRESQGRFRGGLGGMRTPVRPSAATLFKTCTLYFWVYPDLFLKLTTPAPAISSQSHPINPTPLSHFVPQAREVSGFYGFFGIYGGRGW